MSWKSLNSDKETNGTASGFFNLLKRPIEIYVFIDPLCPECWSLEPFLKKLTIEYGRFFTLRPIISGKLASLHQNKMKKPENLKEVWDKTGSRTGMCCDGDVWLENPISSPLATALAVKAAELQGKKAGMRFLRKVQENVFLEKQNISDENVLIECAEKSRLDVKEFRNDLYGEAARRALQCDLKLAHEMDVDSTPTIVIFNESEEDAGLKITGLYAYEVYVKVLKEMLQKDPKPGIKPALEDFLQHYRFVANKEIAVVYDWTEQEAKREMKKLVLKQKVREVPVKHGAFWKYIGS
ncbi:ClpXP adapter SpxH family protein [Halobacillus karajensis]|uniref:ClpXP adapter protein SpxH n=1 Tax=Halobacillus karajensis TaxID=195088 RepID=A0A024P7J9_9BACI|nr:ClpXP adapter SpxH family protein [Halobacillus karajensis]CDQ21016.1 Protein-disulfide isomerase [Halobacillus karajensis]CDQ24920.1 Protein-disulfide isomerase [Halobacillus karajensis]CDQ28719.1 Protein-disulfide isomerase [Halobacillus karajensis]